MKKGSKVVTPVTARRLGYTDEQRLQVLRLLVENGFDYKKTEMDTRVRADTIRQWYYRYGYRLKEEPTAWVAEKIEINIGRLKTDFIRENYKQIGELADKAIKRALTLIDKENDLTKINGTIKILVEFYSKMQDTNKDDSGNNSGNTVNLIRQSIIQLNNLNLKKEDE